jgi:hypothetical protein
MVRWSTTGVPVAFSMHTQTVPVAWIWTRTTRLAVDALRFSVFLCFAGLGVAVGVARWTVLAPGVSSPLSPSLPSP